MTLRHARWLEKLQMEKFLPLCSGTRLINCSGDVAGFTAARGKPAPAHPANAPAMLVIFIWVSTAFPPWLLLPALVPPPAGYWNSKMCGQVLDSVCFTSRSVPGPYWWHSHANSCANKKARGSAEWEPMTGGEKCSAWLKKPCFHL